MQSQTADGPRLIRLPPPRAVILGLGLACAPPGVAQAWPPAAAAHEHLEEKQGRFALNHPLDDFYDAAFVLTHPGTGGPRVVTMEQLADALAADDVVFFGESHRHPGVHLQEMRLLRALHQRDAKIMLSLEQFNRDVQDTVDQYLAGRIGEQTLIDQGRAWDNYLTSYRPLVTYAKDHGLPVIAAEAPDWSIACIGQYGPDILDRFTPLERSWIAQDLHVTAGAYRDKFLGFQQGSATHGGGGAPTTEAQLQSERSFAAQAARDDTMAESIVLARRRYPGWHVLHLTGSFHSAGFLGTVERLRLRDANLKIAVIDPVEVDDPHAPAFGAERLNEGTALALIYPNPQQFAEGEDQSDWVHRIIARRKANPCKYAPLEPAAAASEPTPSPAR